MTTPRDIRRINGVIHALHTAHNYAITAVANDPTINYDPDLEMLSSLFDASAKINSIIHDLTLSAISKKPQEPSP